MSSDEVIHQAPLGHSGFLLEGRAGRVQVHEPAPGVLDIRYRGLAHAGFVPPSQAQEMLARIEAGAQRETDDLELRERCGPARPPNAPKPPL